MDSFIIEKLYNSTADYLVFGTSVESPLFELMKIQDDISCIIKDATIIFDQLLQTGKTENRFMVMKLVDGRFDYDSAKNIAPQLVDDSIKAFICNYLRDNTAVLRHSILLFDQKNVILSGGII